jgi:hypothetical protein
MPLENVLNAKGDKQLRYVQNVERTCPELRMHRRVNPTTNGSPVTKSASVVHADRRKTHQGCGLAKNARARNRTNNFQDGLQEGRRRKRGPAQGATHVLRYKKQVKNVFVKRVWRMCNDNALFRDHTVEWHQNGFKKEQHGGERVQSKTRSEDYGVQRLPKVNEK